MPGDDLYGAMRLALPDENDPRTKMYNYGDIPEDDGMALADSVGLGVMNEWMAKRGRPLVTVEEYEFLNRPENRGMQIDELRARRGRPERVSVADLKYLDKNERWGTYRDRFGNYYDNDGRPTFSPDEMQAAEDEYVRQYPDSITAQRRRREAAEAQTGQTPQAVYQTTRPAPRRATADEINFAFGDG